MRTLISILLTGALVNCGSRAPGPQPTRTVLVPTPASPCLRRPPPMRPTLTCPVRPESTVCDPDLDRARRIDFLVELDRWAQTAWVLCREVKP